jgi:chorismate lyase / 3-hydroxybenzoate synthase
MRTGTPAFGRLAAEPATRPTASMVPAWVDERDTSRLHHASASIGNASGMDILTFQRRVVEAYEEVFEQLAKHAAHPVRFWAFVPGIHDDLGGGLDRYMAFNAGRYGAFAAYFGRPTSFRLSVPTGSAVGVTGDRFMLHCLGANEPGLPVENPRQVSAYHYSRRFGPMPPCFARATLLREGDEPMLLVGGTASITGEESRHIDALEPQVRETFLNLASVVASSSGRILDEDVSADEIKTLLNSFRELRVYHPNPEHRETLVGLIERAFSPQCRVEWLQASLCRRELLVEIEGVAIPG